MMSLSAVAQIQLQTQVCHQLLTTKTMRVEDYFVFAHALLILEYQLLAIG